MQDDRIHWNGEPIAVVLAETQEQADHAASLIEVTYESDDAAGPLRRGPKTPAYARQPRSGERRSTVRDGDAEAALADARSAVDLNYRTPRHNHNAIEPHAVTLALGRRRPDRPRRQRRE